MTKQNKIEIVVIGMLVAIGIFSPIAAYIANRPAPKSVDRVSVVNLPEIIINPDVPVYQLSDLPVDEPPKREVGAAHSRSNMKRRKNNVWNECRLHELEAGGSPTHPFMIACNKVQK